MIPGGWNQYQSERVACSQWASLDVSLKTDSESAGMGLDHLQGGMLQTPVSKQYVPTEIRCPFCCNDFEVTCHPEREKYL